MALSFTGEGHDMPVVIRGERNDKLAEDALTAWRWKSQEKGFPPCDIPADAAFKSFLSLGNGHFFQALNLHRLGCPSTLSAQGFAGSLARDSRLRDAVEHGVASVVLTPKIP